MVLSGEDARIFAENMFHPTDSYIKERVKYSELLDGISITSTDNGYIAVIDTDLNIVPSVAKKG